MFKEPVPCQLTVMVMVENTNNEILTIHRVKSWQGVTFPGGHLLPGESILNCARREVAEETGIVITELRMVGMIHWYNRDNGERYLVNCLRAVADGGALQDSPEGPCAWLTLSQLLQAPLSPGFNDQLKIFTDPHLTEAFGTYGAAGDSPFSYDDGGKIPPCETTIN